MSHVWARKVDLHEPSFYILTRGLVLTGVFLAAGLVLLLASDHWLAGYYARYLTTTGVVLLGTALLGPLLVEDVLRKLK